MKRVDVRLRVEKCKMDPFSIDRLVVNLLELDPHRLNAAKMHKYTFNWPVSVYSPSAAVCVPTPTRARHQYIVSSISSSG